MTQTQHTPGPWEATHRIRDSKSWVVYSVAIADNEICAVFHDGTEELPEANARLIAAAPDLLLALEGLRHMAYKLIDARQDDRHLDEFKIYEADACAVIAKAKGR